MGLRRSVLITPGYDEVMVRKAIASPADVVWLELEDGVHPSQKDRAREIAARLLTDLDWSGKERIVRVNPMYTPDGPSDIRRIAPTRPSAFLLTKVQDASEVIEAARLLDEVDTGGGGDPVKLWCMIETARGLVGVEEIAAASDRVDALFFGGGDLSADLRVKRVGLGSVRVVPDLQGLQFELLYARSRTVAAARANGISAIDVSFNNIRDEEGTHRDALYSFQLGFDGKMAISPRQVRAIHSAFAPSESDLDWATRVLAAFEAVGQDKLTVTLVDDEMVDGPFVRSAQLIVDRARDIAAADAK
jgi:citrate lyase subunit beta/citryl-CoA lyase